MKTLPPEAVPYILATSLMGALFLLAMISLWLLRRTEAKLLKNKDVLEKQILQQQKEIMSARQDSNAWRAEMQRQFDLFRHMASDQLKVEEKRFDDLLQKSREREQYLQTSLDIAKQMCGELPGTKARLLQLESLMGLDSGEHLSPEPAMASNEPFYPMAQLPDLEGKTEAEAPSEEKALTQATGAALESPEPPLEIDTQVRQLQQQNTLLQQALMAARLRSRVRTRQSPQRGRNGKN